MAAANATRRSLACGPDTFLGGAQQAARRALDAAGRARPFVYLDDVYVPWSRALTSVVADVIRTGVARVTYRRTMA